MASEKEFQEKVRQLGALVGELDQMQESGSRASARKLVQLLMEVHGTGLERMMEIVFDSGVEGEAMIAKLGRDSIVRSLLLLYSLHPENLETRVLRAFEIVESRLRKFDCAVKLVSVREGAVQLQVHPTGHVRGSAAKNLRAIVEDGIYEQAPDVASLMILGLEDEDVSGFVPLDRLLKRPTEQVLVTADVEGDGVH